MEVMDLDLPQELKEELKQNDSEIESEEEVFDGFVKAVTKYYEMHRHSFEVNGYDTLSSKHTTMRNTSFNILQTTARFVDYHLYFDTERRRRLLPTFCELDDDLNITHVFLASHLKYCVNDRYFPRSLSRNQITWQNKNQNYDKSKSFSNFSDHDEDVQDIVEHETISNHRDKKTGDSDVPQVVHKYLLFVILKQMKL